MFDKIYEGIKCVLDSELSKIFNILYSEMEIINEKTYYELFNKLENL